MKVTLVCLALLLIIVTAVAAQPPAPPGGISVGPAFFLTVTKSGTGTGTVTGPGINCGSDCLEAYAPNAAVTLTAAPVSGSTFTGWSGGGCSGTGSCSVTMSSAQSVVAGFTSTSPVASVTLGWTDTNTSPQETGTEVWFCQGAGCFPSIGFLAGTAAANATQFTHTPVPAGTLGYAVRAVAPPLPASAFSNTRYTATTGLDAVVCALSTTIFCENFENETQATLPTFWPDGCCNSALQAITTAPANVYAGTKALETTWNAGSAGAGSMTRWLRADGQPTTPLTNYDHVFARVYVKVEGTMNCSGSPPNCPKFFDFGGNQTNDAYASLGRAGECPLGTGRDYFYAGVAEDQSGPRNLIFYDYDAAMVCATPPALTYGQQILVQPPQIIPADTWTCLETEVLMNTVGQSNGEQRIWVNGNLAGTRTGIRWRDTTSIALNSFQLSFSGNTSVTAHVWYDNIVVATQRIFCPTN